MKIKLAMLGFAVAVAGAAGATIRSTVDESGAATCLTIEGDANLANAAVEIAGGENLAEAEVGTEIVVLKATGRIGNWTAQALEIAGKPWKVRVGTATEEVDDGEGGTVTKTYSVLKCVRTAPGLVIIIR